MMKDLSVDTYLQFVYQNDLRGIDDMLASGFDVNAVDKDGRTALMHAILAEHPNSTTVSHLLSRGVDPSKHDRGQRWAALHFAARDQHLDLVEILLSVGTQVDPLDSFGNTPLWRAIMNQVVDLRIVDALIRHGANPDVPNNSGVSPRALAQRLGKADVMARLEAGR